MQNFGAQKCAVEEKVDGGLASLRREGDHLFIFYIFDFCFKRVANKIFEYSWSGGGEFSTRVKERRSTTGGIVTNQMSEIYIFKRQEYYN